MIDLKFLDFNSKQYQSYFDGDELPELSDSKTLNGEMQFKITHEEMVQQWNDATDYELGMLEKGICKVCCVTMQQMHRPKEVVTQVGAARCGLRVGICVTCINYYCTADKLNVLKCLVPFQFSEDQHEINITLNLLNKLKTRTVPIGNTEAEYPLSPKYVYVIGNILEKQSLSLEKSLKEQAKEWQCKTCHQIKLTGPYAKGELAAMNGLRKTKQVAGCCLGCGKGCMVEKGCPIVTCDNCISGTKTCLVCMEGASGFFHNLQECTNKMIQMIDDPQNTDPLPDLKKCECETQVERYHFTTDERIEFNMGLFILLQRPTPDVRGNAVLLFPNETDEVKERNKALIDILEGLFTMYQDYDYSDRRTYIYKNFEEAYQMFLQES